MRLSLGWRMWTSGAVIVLFAVAKVIYGMFEGPITGQIAVGQLQDDAVAYGLAQAGARGAILDVMAIILIVILTVVWTPYLIGLFRASQNADSN